MLTKDDVQDLEAVLQSICHQKEIAEVRRFRTTRVNYSEVESAFSLVVSIAEALSSLPLVVLSNEAGVELRESLRSVASSLEAQNGDELHQHARQLYSISGPALPYLLLGRDSAVVAEQMAKLQATADDAKEVLEENKRWVDSQRNTVDEIVDAIRDSAASAVVAEFTAEFDGESDALGSRAKAWLWGAAVFGGVTVIAAVGSFFWPSVAAEAGLWETIRLVVSKITVIAVLFTSTVWCGRIYRALIHQATVNRHRALSLKTFQSFVKATDDPQVRDAVLMAATKAIFANVPTGLVDQTINEESAVNFVEIGKSSAKGMTKAGAE